MYLYRSEAVLAARMKNIKAFRTSKGPGGKWLLHPEDMDPVLEYAILFAEQNRSFVHHAEYAGNGKAILVVTCLLEEITEAIPNMFTVQPLVAEAWEKQGPKVATGEPREQRAPTEPRKPGAVKTVWDTCSANPTLSRKELVALCVTAGVNPSTASVQVSAWSKVHGGQNSA